jgi:hypothetical protein
MMNWRRNTAVAIGFSFSLLIFVFNNPFGPHPDAFRPEEVIIMFAGPVSLLSATMAGFRWARAAAIWLVSGGATVLVAMVVLGHGREPRLLLGGCLLSLPMFLCASLWFGYAQQREVPALRH